MDWWIDTGLPGPSFNPIEDYSIQSCTGMTVHRENVSDRLTTVFEDVAGDNPEYWEIGDPIFNNGEFVGYLKEISTTTDYIQVPTFSNPRKAIKMDTSYTITVVRSIEEIENSWNLSPFQRRLFRRPEPA